MFIRKLNTTTTQKALFNKVSLNRNKFDTKCHLNKQLAFPTTFRYKTEVYNFNRGDKDSVTLKGRIDAVKTQVDKLKVKQEKYNIEDMINLTSSTALLLVVMIRDFKDRDRNVEGEDIVKGKDKKQ